MADKHSEARTPHAPDYRDDLGSNAVAGQLHGGGGPGSPLHPGDTGNTHSVLRDLAKDELRRIPVLRTGEPLAQGATYIDLAGDCREFTASGDMVATPENWYVRKETVDYRLWNKLLGVESPGRPGTGNV